MQVAAAILDKFFYYEEIDRDELFWLDSPMLEADDEDSVLAVVWLLALTWGSGALIFAFFAGTIGNLDNGSWE